MGDDSIDMGYLVTLNPPWLWLLPPSASGLVTPGRRVIEKPPSTEIGACLTVYSWGECCNTGMFFLGVTDPSPVEENEPRCRSSTSRWRFNVD